jgi:hypothetical protein
MRKTEYIFGRPFSPPTAILPAIASTAGLRAPTAVEAALYLRDGPRSDRGSGLRYHRMHDILRLDSSIIADEDRRDGRPA